MLIKLYQIKQPLVSCNENHQTKLKIQIQTHSALMLKYPIFPFQAPPVLHNQSRDRVGTNDLTSATQQRLSSTDSSTDQDKEMSLDIMFSSIRYSVTSKDVHQKSLPPLGPGCSKFPSCLRIYLRPSECPQLSKGRCSRAWCPHQGWFGGLKAAAVADVL